MKAKLHFLAMFIVSTTFLFAQEEEHDDGCAVETTLTSLVTI